MKSELTNFRKENLKYQYSLFHMKPTFKIAKSKIYIVETSKKHTGQVKVNHTKQKQKNKSIYSLKTKQLHKTKTFKCTKFIFLKRTKKIQRFKIKDDYIYRKNYAEILMLNKPQGKRRTFYLKLLGQNDAHNPET